MVSAGPLRNSSRRVMLIPCGKGVYSVNISKFRTPSPISKFHTTFFLNSPPTDVGMGELDRFHIGWMVVGDVEMWIRIGFAIPIPDALRLLGVRYPCRSGLIEAVAAATTGQAARSV